ncbi:TonB-dependent receptor [Novosphingobium sp.]|uniref:TonB-dependent receptor n=1 Tax=Novosphingobium sp. TaxID=1874826 RepID=UPI0026009DB3|nr:TonB-dependent receptor [Novosphingobium sp.]
MRGSAFEARMSKKASRWLLGTVSSLAVLSIPQAALAQAAPTDEVDPSQIIVTARKQNESLQEVPVTITSVGADVIDKYSVSDVASVVNRVPTLKVQVGGSGSGGQINLRGVGSSAISAAFDSAVALDYDGVQVSTMRLVQAAFVDTAQIDVLKGPQSLFFGKSASAGVLSIRSKDPTKAWEIGARASYEFEERGWLVGGYVSGPLTENLGVRLSGEYNDIDRYLELQAGTPAVNQKRGLRNSLARMTLAWNPVPGFDANLKVQYTHNTNDGAIGHSDIYCGVNGVADPIVLLSGGLSVPAGYNCNYQDSRYFLPDTAPALAVSVPTATGPTKALGFKGVPFGVTDLWFGRLKLDFGFSDHLTLSSVTGYVNLDATDLDNYSYGGAFGTVPFGVGTSDPRNALEQFSQELRLTSKLDGPINFMVGGYYEWRKFIFDTAQNGINISLVAPDPITGFTFDWDKVHTTKTEAKSLFASTIIDITDQLELSGGVRYTKEDKTQWIDVPYVHAFLVGTGLFIPSGYKSGAIPFSDSNWSPEATIKYKISPDVNVFASYKTGFKSGGIDNSALPSNSLSQAALSGDFSSLIFKSESTKGGEVGIKSQFNNRTLTLNATAYWYKFKDLQVQVFDAVNVQFKTLNAGDVTTKGVDLEMGWRTPVEGLTLSGNLSYLDAKFSSSYITFKGQQLQGRDTSNAPRLSGNLAFDWKVPLGTSLEFNLGGNATYSDKYFTTQTSLSDFVQPSYWAFDASASIGHPDGLWKLALIANNITDKIWATTTGDRPFLPAGGDDIIINQNRGRQVFIQGSVKF